MNMTEMDILTLQSRMDQGKLTSKELVISYLKRIQAYDQGGPYINAVAELNPDAVFMAETISVQGIKCIRQPVLLL